MKLEKKHHSIGRGRKATKALIRPRQGDSVRRGRVCFSANQFKIANNKVKKVANWLHAGGHESNTNVLTRSLPEIGPRHQSSDMARKQPACRYTKDCSAQHRLPRRKDRQAEPRSDQRSEKQIYCHCPQTKRIHDQRQLGPTHLRSTHLRLTTHCTPIKAISKNTAAIR